VWLPRGDAYNWYSGLECCISSGFDLGFVHRSQHWYNQGHRYSWDWLSELNLGLPCPTRLASVHLPGTLNNDCPQSSCIISVSLVCCGLMSVPINPACSSVFFLHRLSTLSYLSLSSLPSSSLLCLPLSKFLLLPLSARSIPMRKRPMLLG
jgi:hypothetical protein